MPTIPTPPQTITPPNPSRDERLLALKAFADAFDVGADMPRHEDGVPAFDDHTFCAWSDDRTVTCRIRVELIEHLAALPTAEAQSDSSVLERLATVYGRERCAYVEFLGEGVFALRDDELGVTLHARYRSLPSA